LILCARCDTINFSPAAAQRRNGKSNSSLRRCGRNLPQELNEVPHLLQNLAELSFCGAPQLEQALPTFKLAPHDEQKSDSAMFAAPHVPQRPGSGGT